MQSIRTRVNSVIRRSSFTERGEQSGNESDRPSSIGRKSSDKDSLKRSSTRKRLTNPFAIRNRSGTGDTLEHSQLAKQVVAQVNDDKPTPSGSNDQPDEFGVSGSTPALDTSLEYTKVESPADALKPSEGVEAVPEYDVTAVAVEEQPTEQRLPEDAQTCSIPDKVAEPEITVEEPQASAAESDIPVISEQIVEEVKITAPREQAEPSSSMRASIVRMDGPDGPFDVVMKSSPSHSMVALAVEQPTQAPIESAPGDSSFTSSSSGLPEITPPKPLKYPQPLSAIDELHVKSHPLAEWNAPKEDVNYDADEEENKPLLDSSILSLTENIGQKPYSDPFLTLRTDFKGKTRDIPIYETLGWNEHILPDTSFYFALHVSSPASPQHLKMPTPVAPSPPTVTVVADYDLRNPPILKYVCEEMRSVIKMELPVPGSFTLDEDVWELWLHRPTGYEPTKADSSRPSITHTWVNHARRALVPRPFGMIGQPLLEDSDSKTAVDSTTEENDRDRLAKELAYWSFVERHPAHGVVSSDARKEALEGLTWTYADRLLQSEKLVPPPFSQEECQSLLRLLDGLNNSMASQDRAMSNRIIASILSRIVKTRISTIDKAAELKNLSDESSGKGAAQKGRQSNVTFPFRRAIFGFLSAVVCWGIPPVAGQILDGNGVQMYYSTQNPDVSSQRRTNALLYGAGVGLTAAIMIGSTATILTLRPPLAPPARTASFVALLCAGASLAGAIVSLARMSRMSEDNLYPGYPPSSGYFLPGSRKDTESLMIVNVRAAFSPTSPKPPPTAPSPSLSTRFAAPFRWFF